MPRHTGAPQQVEMSIYRDNLSAIVIGDNFVPIIVIAQNSLDLPITDIAFAIFLLSPINYRDKRFFMRTVFKVRELALRQNSRRR